MAVFRAVLRRDVTLTRVSSVGANALHYACSNPDANGALIKTLIAQPEIRAQLNKGQWPTTLKWKAKFRLAKIAVRFGSTNPMLVNFASSMGQTALHCAARHGNYEACHALVEAGANLKRKDGNGRTPLQLIGGKDDPAAPMLVIILGGRPLDRIRREKSRFSSTRSEGGSSSSALPAVQPAVFLSRRMSWEKEGKKGGRWGLVKKSMVPSKASGGENRRRGSAMVKVLSATW